MQIWKRYNDSSIGYLSAFIFNYTDLGINSRGLLGQITRWIFGDNTLESARASITWFAILSFLGMMYVIYRVYTRATDKTEKLYVVLGAGLLIWPAYTLDNLSADFFLMVIFITSIIALFNGRYELLFVLSCIGIMTHNIYLILFIPFAFVLVTHRHPKKVYLSLPALILVIGFAALSRILQSPHIRSECVNYIWQSLPEQGNDANAICFALSQSIRQAIEYTIKRRYFLEAYMLPWGLITSSPNEIVNNIVTVIVVTGTYIYTFIYGLRYNNIKNPWLYLVPFSLIVALAIGIDYTRWFTMALFTQLVTFYALSKLDNNFSLKFITDNVFYTAYAVLVFWVIAGWNAGKINAIIPIAICGIFIVLWRYIPKRIKEKRAFNFLAIALLFPIIIISSEMSERIYCLFRDSYLCF